MSIVQTIHVSVDQYKLPAAIHAVQNDSGRTIKMVVDDMTLTAGMTGKLSFRRSSGTYYELSATLDTATNSFSAELDQALTSPGTTHCQLKVTSSGELVSSFDFDVFVEEDRSGTVTPEEGISISQAVEAAEDAADRAESAAEELGNLTDLPDVIAPAFSTSVAYSVGDYVMYNGSLYRFTQSHAAGAWNAGDVTEVTMGEEVGELKDAYDAYTETLPGKNLVNVTRSNNTVNSVAFTNNGDGTVTANGTASAKIQATFGNCYLYAGRTYILSGLEDNDTALQVLNYENTTVITQEQNGAEVSFTVPSDGVYNIRFYCGNGKNINETIKPMVRDSMFLDGTFEKKTKAKSGVAIWIGDSFVKADSLNSYGLDQTKRFSTLVSKYFNLTEKNYAVGGMGYITGQTPFSAQLTTAIADYTYNHDDVTHVFMCGGINDLNTADKETLLAPAVKSLVDRAYAEYTNAKIYVIPLMYYDKNLSQDGYWEYKTIANVCAEAKAVMIGNAYTWLNGMAGDILPDNTHPNIDGHALIASHIQNALLTGDSYAYPASCSYEAYSSKIDTNSDNYFCTIKRNGEITVNGIFTLTENVAKYERLFEYIGTGKNNPTFVGRYGKHVMAINMDTGATVVLLVMQEDVTEDNVVTGYKNYCQAMMAISAGTYKVLTAVLNVGIQEYAGNKT